jgi:hypothetical protein
MIEFFSTLVRLCRAIVGAWRRDPQMDEQVPYPRRPGLLHAAWRDDLLHPRGRAERGGRLLLRREHADHRRAG